jgi:hypothetical protein
MRLIIVTPLPTAKISKRELAISKIMIVIPSGNSDVGTEQKATTILRQTIAVQLVVNAAMA